MTTAARRYHLPSTSAGRTGHVSCTLPAMPLLIVRSAVRTANSHSQRRPV